LFQNDLVFKGGTALRKFRAGNSGRFSTDLDFAAPDENLALAVFQALDGAEIDGFAFAIDNLGDDGRRGDLRISTPFGQPQLGAKVELARHALSLEPDVLNAVRLPIHDGYDFDLPPTPVVRVEEAIAEKLARYRRVPLARDLGSALAPKAPFGLPILLQRRPPPWPAIRGIPSSRQMRARLAGIRPTQIQYMSPEVTDPCARPRQESVLTRHTCDHRGPVALLLPRPVGKWPKWHRCRDGHSEHIGGTELD
jgi:Nucleotidyl transferase AbiEii toxin, Type IV TA system